MFSRSYARQSVELPPSGDSSYTTIEPLNRQAQSDLLSLVTLLIGQLNYEMMKVQVSPLTCPQEQLNTASAPTLRFITS